MALSQQLTPGLPEEDFERHTRPDPEARGSSGPELPNADLDFPYKSLSQGKDSPRIGPRVWTALTVREMQFNNQWQQGGGRRNNNNNNNNNQCVTLLC